MHSRRQSGFTLMEMVVAIAVMGVVSLAAVPLMRLPMAAWMDASRRSDLVQALDTAHASLADDFRHALPNSVRIRQVGPRVLVEMLEVRARGRHRHGPSGGPQACPASCSGAGAADQLEASCIESCFTSIGSLEGSAPVPGDWVVVNPIGPGAPAGDPYLGGNVAVAGGIKARLVDVAPATDGSRVRMAPHSFAALAPSRRFHVVSTPITWDCDPGAQSLTRRWGYPVAAVQPLAFGAAAASPAATGVVACSARYQPAGLAGRGGLLTLTVRMSRSGAGAGGEPVELVAALPVSEGP